MREQLPNALSATSVPPESPTNVINFVNESSGVGAVSKELLTQNRHYTH